jgi:hypothetical protein
MEVANEIASANHSKNHRYCTDKTRLKKSSRQDESNGELVDYRA